MFSRGQGIDLTGSISDKFINHLLCQYDGRFAKDTKFIFTLFNQKQRHILCRDVKVKAQQGKDGTFAKISEIVNNKDFVKDVSNAVKNPDEPSSVDLLNKLQSLIKLGGMNVPFSEEERKAAQGQIYSLIVYFG